MTAGCKALVQYIDYSTKNVLSQGVIIQRMSKNLPSLTDQDSLQFIDLRDEILYLTQNNSDLSYNCSVPTNKGAAFL